MGERTVRIRKVKGSNPSVSTKKKDRLFACPFFGMVEDARDSNHVRTCRWHVHEPVHTLANTYIPFSVPRKGKRNASESLRLHQKYGICFCGYRVFLYRSKERPQRALDFKGRYGKITA